MRGGLHLLAHTERVTDQALARATMSRQLAFRISPSAQEPTDILVTVDERVLLGQPLARCGASIIHSSVSGIVRGIHVEAGQIDIVVDNDERDEPHATVRPIPDFKSVPAAALRARIAAAGIVGLGGAAFPTIVKLDAAMQRHADLLIVNGAECEPFIACDEVLMRERAKDVLLGTQALLRASETKRAVIAIESDQTRAIAAMTQALTDEHDASLTLQVIDTFYPAGGERQLITALTGKEVPKGKLPQDIGVVCQNVGTAAAVARLIAAGEPLIERIVTITGSGVNVARNLIARIGTPIANLIADCGGYVGHVERLIMGGSMMGIALPSDDVAVTPHTNCVVVATADDLAPRGPELPCIRCGDCATACPAMLLPQQLLRYARLNDRAALTELGLRDCIECGCCDYVCPSHIPLTSTFVAAKNRA